MASANDILRKAASYIGVKESPANSNNVIFNTHYYGGPVNDESLHWCAAFVWDIFRMCGASALYYGGKKTAHCETLLYDYRTKKQIVDKSQAQKGDIVFFNFNGGNTAGHVGICESATSTTITTIDGNTGSGNEANGGAVMRRTRNMKYVVAVARPAYNGAVVTPVEPTVVTPVEPTVSVTPVSRRLAGAMSKDKSAKHGVAFKTITGLNIRYGPDKDKYASIKVLPKGTKVMWYGYYTGNWYLVKAGSTTGYCHKKYLAK